jgi:dienelactone hydrolase
VLAHGTEDEKVPVDHARELGAALAAAGKDLRLRFVPGGNHRFEPVTNRLEVTEESAEDLLRSARREGPDDFESGSCEEFACPGATFRLDFRSGRAEFSRGPG